MHGSAVAKEQTNNQKKKKKKLKEHPIAIFIIKGKFSKKIITLNLVLLASKSKK